MNIGKMPIDDAAERILMCRKIVNEIENFGVNELQRLHIIYLLSLTLENRDHLTEISSIVKKHLGDPIEDASKNKLEF